MSGSVQDEQLETLLRIESLLEDLLAIQKIGQTGNIQKAKEKMLSGIRGQVYELCNGKYTVNDIAAKMRKKPQNVSRALAELEDAGLVRPIQAGNHVYYEQLV